MTNPRFVIPGEDRSAYGDWRIFEIEFAVSDGHEYAAVWARSANEALGFVHPYKGGKLAQILRNRSPHVPS
jgi:hypothetical protein